MPNHPTEDARALAEEFLVRTGRAMDQGDFDAFMHCFELPQEIDTFDGRKEVRTMDEFRATFELVRHHYRTLGVTHIVRHVVHAEFADDTTLQSTHETRLLNGDQLVQSPYPVFTTWKRRAEGWKIISSQYAIADAPEHNAALRGLRPHGAETTE